MFILFVDDHLITAPRVFSMFFGLLKPFIHETDFPKIKIFATNKDEWTAALLDEIEADQLPAIYGGTMTNLDGNPNCSLKVGNCLHTVVI